MKALIIVKLCVWVVVSWYVTFSFALDKDAVDAHNPGFPRHIDAQAAKQNADAINLSITDAQAFKLVNTPNVKLQLARQIGKGVTANGIIFLPGTGALDTFDLDKFCYTVEFKLDPIGLEGVMSALYKMVGIRPKLEKLSFWFIRTRVSGDIFTQTWSPAKSPYYIDDWTRIVSGETLTILPGTVIRVRKFSDPMMKISLDVDEGSYLIAKGKEDQPIQFTSSCDLEDLDKIQNTYETSDWRGIYCYRGKTTLDYALVEYASHGVWGHDASIYITNSVLRKNDDGVYGYTYKEVEWVIQNNLIEDFAYGGVLLNDYSEDSSSQVIGNTIQIVTDGFYPRVGIDCWEGSPVIKSNTIQGASTGIICGYVSPQIAENTIQADWTGLALCCVPADTLVQGNTITNSYNGIYCVAPETKAKIIENDIRENEYGIYCLEQANPAIHFNNIEKNRSFGVYNEDCGVIVDATNNWWGHATGPFHPVDNPGGLGNQVSDCVDFDPWLPGPVALLAAAPQAVAAFSLGANFPNPSNPETWFPYSLAKEADVTIHIYNASGQLVRTLNLGTKPVGVYTTKGKAAYWDGRDSLGQKVASGVYFYQLKVGEFTAMRKMVILK